MNDNYNEKNIENLRKYLKERKNTNNKVWRLVEPKFAPCEVKINEKSRKICAKALLD